jgi:hypothetical protein
MAVRIRIKIKTKNGKSVETSAVANSGLETYEPEIVLPLRLAEKLKLWPPKKGIYKTYVGVTGSFPACSLEEKVEVTVITKDKKPKVESLVTIFEREMEALLSDKLLSALGIVLVDVGNGIWRFIDDEPNVQRKSEKREIWI